MTTKPAVGPVSGTQDFSKVLADTKARDVAAASVGLGGALVADLDPAAAIGARSCVTNALAPTFLAVVAGGGAIFTPVIFDGTNWRCG